MDAWERDALDRDRLSPGLHLSLEITLTPWAVRALLVVVPLGLATGVLLLWLWR